MDRLMPRSGRTRLIFRTGLWLSFLLVGLSLPLTYLLQAPAPIGSGLLRVFGWGGLTGAGVGVLVLASCPPIYGPRSRWSKIKAGIGYVALGAFGGAGGAAWIDQLRVVNRQHVELPIVKIEQLSERRSSSGIQVSTLSPLNPTGQDHVAAEYIDDRKVREGDCLSGVVERGWLGGVWVRRYKTRSCSKERGLPGSHVIISVNDFSSWRWHQPRNFRPENSGQALDDAMPVNLTCRLRPGSWLYRCSPR